MIVQYLVFLHLGVFFRSADSFNLSAKFLFYIFTYLVCPICGFSTLETITRLKLLYAFHMQSLCLSRVFSVSIILFWAVYFVFYYVYLLIRLVIILFWSLICFSRTQISIFFQVIIFFHHFFFGLQYVEFIFLLTCSITQNRQGKNMSFLFFFLDLELLMKILKIFVYSKLPEQTSARSCM